jgi:hypothetical protein
MKATTVCPVILPVKTSRFMVLLKCYWNTPIGCEIAARWLAGKRSG